MGMKPSDSASSPLSPLRRLQVLSDMIFAVTLVTLGLVFPWPELDRSARDPVLEVLGRTFSDLISILITYVVVALYWVKHVTSFKHLVRVDKGQLTLQLGYLLGVTALPFTVWLTVELSGFTASLVLHSVNLLWMGVFSILSWKQASRKRRLVSADLDGGLIRQITRSEFVEPIVLVISIAAAPLGVTWWSLSFLLLFIIPLFLKGPKEEEGEGRAAAIPGPAQEAHA